MLLSTFELLLKKITPTPGTITGSDRKVLQGYFLNIANPNNTSSRIRLRFNAKTPSLDPSTLLTAVDTGGNNVFSGTLVSDGPNRFNYDFTLDAGDTGLFILQPNIKQLNPDTDEFEVRGFVEVFVLTPFFTFVGATEQLMLTPEHRGTFLPSPNNSTNDFDQLNVAIPTSTGAGLMNVDFLTTFVLPEIPTPRPLPPVAPISPITESSGNANSEVQLQASLPQILNAMAKKIESIEERLPSAQS